ncbi:ROK family protein [Paenibacillus prosopidis]|uniref:fructokinase n=1 Tax=Paenibacillus prosopidis TaxID=630520 RepID=A0A368VIR2_9BACL|nr:ROK family protein [Paenibacillus prosopidis]RCW41101.1 fructokinase [Paenibacillus prosopidis]
MTLLGAIEGGGTKFVCGIGTREGQILERSSFPTTTPEETMGRAFEFFANKGIHAIGIGTFGPIDGNLKSESYGCITNTPKPYWSGFNVVDFTKSHLDVPVGFDTDVNAAALGEASWGAAKGLGSCLYMTVGTGIGAGAFIEGRLIHGLTHPEMGHTIVRRHPNDTYEGNCPFHKDCLEGLASGPAIEDRWKMKAFDLEAAHFAWGLEAYYLAQALVNFILILSPEKIILGGGVMKQIQLYPLIQQQLNKLLKGYINHPALAEGNSNYIVQPALGDNAGLSGALALADRALQGYENNRL